MRGIRTISTAATGRALVGWRPSTLKGGGPARPKSRVARRHPLSVSRCWPEIYRLVRRGNRWALFLDFDGTLAPIRRFPADVRCSQRTKQILNRLAQRPNLRLSVISGRRAGNLRELIGVEGIHYLGAYGAETADSPPALGVRTRRALARTKRDLTAQLGSVPGIRVEDKGLGLAVHCRAARSPAVQAAAEALRRVLAPARRSLRVITGEKIWEIVPREFAGKGAAVRAAMEKLPPGTAAIYIGDDAADEPAFSALANGITVRVGRTRNTRARYFLRSPAEVVQFLARFEEGLK